jgi:LysM repeat protein
MKVSHCICLWFLSAALALAQTDPGAKEDQEAARQKLLRASDQLDAMSTQVEALHTQTDQQKAEIDDLKSQLTEAKNAVTQLKNDIAALQSAIEKLDAARAEERDILLKKVAEIVADASKNKSTPAPDTQPPPVATPSPATPPPPTADEKGYYYIVKKGDTLHDIAAAYVGQGVNVTVDDLRKANNIAKTAYIHVGQKLFIPKKE